MEEWKDIQGYEGLYQVSNYGRVKSLEREIIGRWGTKRLIKERILKNGQNKKRGYNSVALNRDGIRITNLVHRLVAEAFIPNPNDYDTVHHKNHNPQDNRVENLEWMPIEQHTKEHKNDRVDGIKKKMTKTVYQYTLDDKLIAIYPSTMEVQRKLGYSNSDVSMASRNKFHKKGNNIYNGYKWSYEPL